MSNRFLRGFFIMAKNIFPIFDVSLICPFLALAQAERVFISKNTLFDLLKFVFLSI